MERNRVLTIGVATGLALGAVGVSLLVSRPGSPPAPLPRSWSAPTVEVADPWVGPRPPAPAGAPNLVLVIGCTVRKDQTSPYGGPPSTTPFLASLSAEGVVLDDLVTAAPWTRASSTAILTGRHAVSLGMVDPGPVRDDRPLPESARTLAEHLREQGYATIGLATNPNLNAEFGFQQGFDRYLQLEKLWREESVKWPGADAALRAAAMVDTVEPGRPFYLQVLLVDAHAPFPTDPAELAAQDAPGLPDEVRAYRASLRRLDDAVAALDAELRARGHDARDTLFVFVNDHGEGLSWPEHHGRSHGRFLYPSAVGGVAVARGPGLPAGARIRGLVSGIDLAPTLVGLLPVAPFPADGQDLSAAWRAGGETGRGEAFTDTWFKTSDRAAVYLDDRMCQVDLGPAEGDALGGGRFETGCFDRAGDPTFARPVRDEAGEQRVRAWRAAREPERAAAAGGAVEPGPELERQLQALGYTR